MFTSSMSQVSHDHSLARLEQERNGPYTAT
jgi:hypothetical protein